MSRPSTWTDYVVLSVLAGALAVLFLSACGGEEGGSMTFSDQCKKSDEKQFAAPDTMIDVNKSYVATIVTDKGDIVLDLSPKAAPETVNSFVFLSCKGFYDGVIFHRVEPGFVIQGGDPTGTGTGGPGYTVPAEFESSNFETGVLGLARSAQPDSGGSQFFIMLGPASSLNGQYTAFGSVSSGMDVVQQIAVGDVIDTITIEER